MSRNPHQPTDTLRTRVRTLSASGLPQEDICAIIGCSPKTLRQYYRAELDEGAAHANAVVTEALHRLIKNGNLSAMMFFEKCKGGKRETIREEITGPGGRPVEHRSCITISPRCALPVCDENIERDLRSELSIKHRLTQAEREWAIRKVRDVIAKRKKSDAKG